MIQAWLLKQAPYLILSVGLLLLGYWVGSALIERGRAELRPVIEQLQSDLASERASRIRNEEALDAYQKELSVIRSRPRPSTPVRLCVTPSVREASAAASGADGAPAGSGSDAGSAGADYRAGPDIGAALRELAYQCDAENAKLRALQGWVNGLD
jgi:hypothetical protein